MSQTMPWAAVAERLAPPSTEGTEFEQDAIFARAVCASGGHVGLAMPACVC